MAQMRSPSGCGQSSKLNLSVSTISSSLSIRRCFARHLSSVFAWYDHLFTRVIPHLGQPHSLYAKMMLKGLLLLSLAGRAATAVELADAVMLYDDREPKQFSELMASIMTKLAVAHAGISV